MKKLLLLFIIFLQVICIFFIFSTTLIPFALGQGGNGNPERLAEGEVCEVDQNQCETGTRCFYDKNDVRMQKVPEDKRSTHGVCIKNVPIQPGNDPKKVNCQHDQSSDLSEGSRGNLAYATCAAGSICNDGKCEKFSCIQAPHTNADGKPIQDTVKCEGDIRSRDRDKLTGGKTCCAKLTCDTKSGQCKAAEEEDQPTNACIKEEGKPCKNDIGPDERGRGANIEESCCEGFRCEDTTDDKKDNKTCVSTKNKDVCIGEGKSGAEGDTTTKNDDIPLNKLCCDDLIHKDGTCIEEKVCKQEKSTCTAKTICCGEMSCIQGKCMEGIPNPPSPPCSKFDDKGKCSTVQTAFGDMSTDPESFIQKLFAILLSLSGGVALLLTIKSGYLIMTSQGKPEAIQAGRDQLTAAIVGLIFLIFSFVILQTIGVDLLHINIDKAK